MKSSNLVGPVVVHSDGIIDYANPSFRSAVGAAPDTGIAGMDILELVAPTDREALSTQFETIAASGADSLGLAIRLETLDGNVRDVIAVSSPIEWEGDARLQTTFIDVARGAHQSAATLRESAMYEAPIGITIADASHEDVPLIYANNGFVELTGYPREDVLGQNCRFLQGEDTRAEPVRRMREAIEDREPVTVELRNYRKDGTLFWNRVTISPVADGTGEVTHFLGFQEDISAGKVYEQEKALFEKHAAASEQMMFITDCDGVIEYVNPALERMTGYSESAVLGERPTVFKSDDQEGDFFETLPDRTAPSGTWKTETTNQSRSGELFQVEQTIVPIMDDRGEVTHFAAIERDITDEKFTEQVLDVLNRVLRHNLRTSVNVIDGYATLLEGETSQQEQQTAARVIRERTAALKTISEQTTAIRELVRGHGDPHPLTVAGITTIVERCRKDHEDAEITVENDVVEQRVVRNGDVLQVALEEVIENAVVHNDQEQPVVDITLTDSGDSELLIEIADNGPGIPGSEWEVIKTGTETPLVHNQGLGLWLMYWSVTALGGTIELTENTPQGSVVTFHVPAEPAPESGE